MPNKLHPKVVRKLHEVLPAIYCQDEGSGTAVCVVVLPR